LLTIGWPVSTCEKPTKLLPMSWHVCYPSHRSIHVVKEKVTKEKGHPAWRLPGIGQLLLRCLNSGIHALAVPGKSVSRGRAFRTGILPVRKGVDFLSTPATRPVDPTSPPHKGPGRAARHPGAHSVRHRCAVAEKPIAPGSSLTDPYPSRQPMIDVA